MLPDKSRLSMRSRPVLGSSMGSPTHCGRAIAVTTHTQARNSPTTRNMLTDADTFPSPWSRCQRALNGARIAAPNDSDAGGRSRTKSGSTSNVKAQGQRKSSTRHLMLFHPKAGMMPIGRSGVLRFGVMNLRENTQCFFVKFSAGSSQEAWPVIT